MSQMPTDRGGPCVMHVITPSRMAGAETFLARLIRRATSTNSRCPPFHCLTSRGRASGEMRAAGLAIEELGISGKANVMAPQRIRRAAKRVQADLLHSHLSTASWWCGWLESFGGPPSIGHVHGFTSARWHSRQTHLIACSEAVKADLVDKGIAPQRVTVMHYPVDLQDMHFRHDRSQIRAELGVDENTPVVGTFAHLSLKKGYRELIRAAEVVLRKLPSAQFWCCGEGPLRPELEQFARDHNLSNHFRLLGFRRDVPDLMRAVDVMCLPSHREPFGLVYVEAALAERPVIACRAGGAPEIIQHGETGLLVPPPGLSPKDRSPQAVGGNVEPISAAILTLLADRSLSGRLGRLGREHALERFGWSNYLSRLNQLYATFRGAKSLTRSRPHVRSAVTTSAG